MVTRQELAEHPLWAAIDRVRSVLPEVDTTAALEAASELDAVRLLLARTEELRDPEEVALVGQGMLSRVTQAWTEVADNLTTYVANPDGNLRYLSAAIQRLEVVREALASFPRPQLSAGTRAALTRSLSSYVEMLEGSRQALAEVTEATREEQSRRDAQHLAEVQALNDQISTLTRELEALETRVTAGQTRLETALTTTNEAFIASQSARETAFKDWLQGQELDFLSQAAPHIESIKAGKEEAAAALARIEELRSNVTDMSNIAAGDILAGDYAESATSDRRAAFIAYVVGGLAGLTSILIILYAFGSTADAGWTQVALKLGLTAAVGGLAAVAFRFGGQSLRRATSFKRQELELRALQPFLSGVENADEAKTAFIARSFGHAWTTEGKSGTTEVEAETSEMVRLAMTLVERIPKT